MGSKKIGLKQVLVYLLGNIILAAGVCLNTKTHLGVSPVISVAYNGAQIFKLSIGIATFVYYCFLIFLQFCLLRKNFEAVQLLQVIASFLSSFFIQLYDTIFPVPESLLSKWLLLFIAIILTGIGASLTIAMQIIPNPADGLANTLGFVCRRNFGFGKNLLDAICILIALFLGWFFRRSFLGIGFGTVVAMLMTGRVIAFCHPYSEKLFAKL
ncbi:YczE/YyaS/YitT family protein [Streptococcus caviae]|uniref:YczE/YyaS/YitT family protein n=1 Tax=Streptococcus sp. 'caviae' TaxID=1915004 RepID=UPI00115682B5|nr:DUF6198 family protein [Streptococcus sp. 'caviae']